jgi:hypothetical protein
MVLHMEDDNMVLFADDTTITIVADSVSATKHKFDNVINRLETWIDHNRLFLNCSKTKAMFLVDRRDKDNYPNEISFKDNVIEIVKHFKLLGVEIDRMLLFRQLINDLKRKVYFRLHSMKHLYYMPLATKVDLFKCYVVPHFDYIMSLTVYFDKWAIHQLEALYNRAIKQLLNLIIKHMDHDACLQLLTPYRIMHFMHRCVYRLNIMTHRIFHKVYLPELPEFGLNLNKRYQLRGVPNRPIIINPI